MHIQGELINQWLKNLYKVSKSALIKLILGKHSKDN